MLPKIPLYFIFIYIFTFFFSHHAHSQFKKLIISTPDSAAVYVNDALECSTPCEVKYRWKDKKEGKMIFTVKVPGFKPWNDTLYAKPTKFFKKHKVNLIREKLEPLIPDSIDTAIDFDKLLVEFEDGTPIGMIDDKGNKSNIVKWDGKPRIGVERYKHQFYETAAELGYKTPQTRKVALFDESKTKRPVLPRYIVGIKVSRYNVKLDYDEKHLGAGYYKGRVDMDFEWQVFDKKSGKVEYTYQNAGHTNFRIWHNNGSEENLNAYQSALIDFLTNSDLKDMVENARSGQINPYMLSENGEERFQKEIQKVKEQNFQSLGEMIRFSERSCITVVTDAGHGSGVIIDPDGLIITAYHVVEGVNKIKIQFSDGFQLDAELVNFDYAHDVALLKIPGSGFKPLPIHISEENQLGEDIITIGTPASLDLGQSVAKGVISGKRLFDDIVYMQIDMSVSPGNSGGPVINSKGEIMGIIQRKVIREGVEGIGFALPISTACSVLGISILE